MSKKFHTAPEVAEIYGVNLTKVNGWIHSGDLRAVNVAQSVGNRPRWRIPDDALVEFDQRRAAVQVSTPAPRRRRPSGDVPSYV